MSKILVAEISGKRPGDSKARATELFPIKYDHLIISNNSDGYETDWPIVMVPPEYMEWYKANVKTSDSAWYAPMNRSYAIKYAREHGYNYLIQLDDNITRLEIAYMIEDADGIIRRYRSRSERMPEMMNDYIDMLCCVLENTNAGMAGCELNGIAVPDGSFLKERYCYSLFALNLAVCPDLFHGDFEDARYTIYTGAIDRYFGYRFGALQYRSVSFATEILDIPNYQGNAVVNYTDRETPYTRIIEHKHFDFGKQPKTVISFEYSTEWKPGADPFYPVNDERNNALYQKYQELANKETGVLFGGRLGRYRYYDMDQTVADALSAVGGVR